MKNKKSIYSSIDENGEMTFNSNKKKQKNLRWNLPIEYGNLGMYLVIPLLLAVFIGKYLDKRFEKNGAFTIILIILGTVSVFYNLYKLSKQK
ncbi:hypothetical protein COY14_04330 [Candidatus Roizmanbacteria bacterium CG_4_10_14_0_2_um_filter_36_9]|uniref:F0F1 ATP synthase subunit n=1 Tax=Candidatus Roizmanbacteria bacterium CG_4_10_14_0_2_um_filter_36_9 TaxID=1974823 RepID=A0A2M7U2S1_9BACT|nr:MAG: hypothetical protein COY14_04330 [Candidatus Roizmanbacteria bacterium CG_4_10_14_0_2_um_filter_36_9]